MAAKVAPETAPPTLPPAALGQVQRPHAAQLPQLTWSTAAPRWVRGWPKWAACSPRPSHWPEDAEAGREARRALAGALRLPLGWHVATGYILHLSAP